MPPKLQRSVTGAAVSVGVQGASAIVKGVIDILSVIPYLFAKVISVIAAALKYAGQNIAQAIGFTVMMFATIIYIDSVFNIRRSLSCIITPSLCATGSDVGLR